MKYKLLLFTLFLFFSCSDQKNDYKTHLNWTEDINDQWLNRVIRYVSKAPGKGNQIDRFSPEYDEYYENQKNKHRIDLFFKEPNTGYVYLLITRIAPSLVEKRVATGIKLKWNNNSLEYYQEVFRTWKMTEDELTMKGEFLFDLMVKGKDLSPYFPQNSGKEEFIEFPDEHTYYDTINRVWVSDLIDPLYSY